MRAMVLLALMTTACAAHARYIPITDPEQGGAKVHRPHQPVDPYVDHIQLVEFRR
jgi:hypothetical protein